MLRRASLMFLAFALVAVAACGDSGDDDEPDAGDEARPASGGVEIGPADEGIDGVVAFRIESAEHTEEDLAYDPAPPAGGEHYPVPGTCGFYTSDAPADELLVHDLEHGAIWIAYDPSLDAAGLDALRSLVAEQAKVMATPYEGLPSPLVVTAWGRQLELDGVDDPRLVQFIETYRNSENAPEPNAPCQGAGEPEVASPTG